MSKLFFSAQCSQQHSNLHSSLLHFTSLHFFTSPSFSPIYTVPSHLTYVTQYLTFYPGGSWFDYRLEQRISWGSSWFSSFSPKQSHVLCSKHARTTSFHFVHCPFVNDSIKPIIWGYIIRSRYSVVKWIINQQIKIHINLKQ